MGIKDLSECRNLLETSCFIEGLPGWSYGATLGAVIAGVVLSGRFLSRPLFRMISRSGRREMFTATALMLVIGIAALMSIVGLSAKIYKLRQHQGWLLTLSIAQAREFGFVLSSFALNNQAVSSETMTVVSPVIALSMFLTPVLFIIYDKFILARYKHEKEERDTDPIGTHDFGEVLIAGIGRFGQIVNRMLVANGIKTIVLDHNADIIDRLSRIHVKPFFGDVRRPELLEDAGIAEVKVAVIALDDIELTNILVAHIKQTYPQTLVMARSFDSPHTYRLKSLGADFVVAETFYSAAELGREVLGKIRFHPFEAAYRHRSFLTMDSDRNHHLYQSWKEGNEPNTFDRDYIELFIKLEKELSQQMQSEHRSYQGSPEQAWVPQVRQSDDKL